MTKRDLIVYLCLMVFGAVLMRGLLSSSSGDTVTDESVMRYGEVTYQMPAYGFEEFKLTEQKLKQVMTQYGYSDSESDYIIQVCSQSKDYHRCVKHATAIAWHETKTGKQGTGKSHKNNLYGLTTCISPTECRYKSYPNRMASFEDWVARFDQYRWKNSCEEMITRSRYTNTKKAEWIGNCEWMRSNFERT